MNTLTKHFLSSLGVVLLLAAPVVKVASASAYEQGLEAVANYRYAAALMHFQVAAEQGDRSARRNLGLMQLYGELLYGNEVPRNQEQARRWLEAAAADGCEVSAFMVKTLAQHAH